MMLSWRARGEGFSEFTYGFALTNELVNIGNPPILSAPIFPSLIAEGRAGGYDVMLDRPGKPIFIQFKLSRLIRGHRAVEFRNREFYGPFYRMMVRSRARSRQHDMLIDLETQNNGGVYYYAPSFHAIGQLNPYYRQRQVEARSRRVRPSELRVPDDGREHWLSFQQPRGGPLALHSEESSPVELDDRPTQAVLEEQLVHLPPHVMFGDALKKIAGWMMEEQLYEPETAEPAERLPREASSVEVVALTSQLVFDSTLFVLQARER